MLDWFMELVQRFGETVMRMLPRSPVKDYINNLGEVEFLSYLNWFIPIGMILKVLSAYLTAIALFYCYSLILRWIKAL